MYKKIGPTPGDSAEERIHNLIKRNQLITDALQENRFLYNCIVCNFWPTDFVQPVCDSCLKKYTPKHGE